VCCSHGGDESPLLSVCSSGGGLSRGHGGVLLPLSGGCDDNNRLLLIDGEVAVGAWHGQQDGGG
jgi:hypothetical protein